MTHHSAHPGAVRATLADRYVHAATRRLPEELRGDVADELRASIADRVDSLRAAGSGLSLDDAEYAALEELGDPDRMAAGYSGTRLQLIGPEIYPTYVRVLKSVLLVAVPAATLVIATIDSLTGEPVGPVIGHAAWMAFTISVQIAFWVTIVFALVERSSAPEDLSRNLSIEWAPERLPDLPQRRGSLADLVASATFLALMGVAIVWQQFSSPIHDAGERVPVLDPDLWSFWLPLLLALLAAEVALEVVKYRSDAWSPRLAAVNTVLGFLFSAPLVYLAARDLLLNPDAVRAIQEDWSSFDPQVVNTVVIVTAVVIWAWDSVDGWRKALDC